MSFNRLFQVGLPSLLTAVLLRAAPPKTTPEQAAAALPANFEEVATLVLRVLNNLARLDLKLFQAQLVSLLCLVCPPSASLP
jgi:hypothetical protein